MKYSIGIISLFVLLLACEGQKLYTPKPRSYPRIIFPERETISFDRDYCDFQFTYPTYANIIKDEYFFDEKPADDCWFDIELSPFNGALHCSYIPLSSRADFDAMINDAFTMVGKHNIKAQFRDDFPIVKEEEKVYGMLFELEGEVASKLQFYLSDSTNHFFRAALYFNSKVNPDSIAPIYDFVKQDVLGIIESFEWK